MLSSLANKNIESAQPRLLMRAIRWVFAAVGLPPPPLDKPTLRVLVRDFEMQFPELPSCWDEDPGRCAQCAQHICAVLFELACGERNLAAVGPGQSVPVPSRRSWAAADGVSENWFGVYAPLLGNVSQALASLNDVEKMQELKLLFWQCGTSPGAALQWRLGEVQRFSGLLFEAHLLPPPACPNAVWYQLVREQDVGIGGVLEESESVAFARCLFLRILSFFPPRHDGASDSKEQVVPLPTEFACPVMNSEATSTFAQSLLDRMVRKHPPSSIPRCPLQAQAAITSPSCQDVETLAQPLQRPLVPLEHFDSAAQASNNLPEAVACSGRLNKSQSPKLPSTSRDLPLGLGTLVDRLDLAARECAVDHERIRSIMEKLKLSPTTDSGAPTRSPSPVNASAVPTGEAMALSTTCSSPTETDLPVASPVAKPDAHCVTVSAVGSETGSGTRDVADDTTVSMPTEVCVITSGCALDVPDSNTPTVPMPVLDGVVLQHEVRGGCLPGSCSRISQQASADFNSGDLAGGPQPGAMARCRNSIGSGLPSAVGSRRARMGEGDASNLLTDCSVMTFLGIDSTRSDGLASEVERRATLAECSNAESEGSELERAMMKRRREIDDRTVLYTKDGAKAASGVGWQVSDGGLSRQSSACAIAFDVPSPCRRRRGRERVQESVLMERGRGLVAPQVPEPSKQCSVEAACLESSLEDATGPRVEKAHVSVTEDISTSVMRQLTGAMSSEREGNEPELLALVQATCECLVERLKQNQMMKGRRSRTTHRESSAERPQEAALTAAIAAATATRDLLGEVEMAFLGSGSRSRACSEASSRAGSALPGFGGQTAKPGTQWFSVSTPTEAGVPHSATPPTLGAAGFGVRPQRNRQRHSWPRISRSSGASGGAESSGSGSPALPTDHLGEWVEELQLRDPCPLIRPPRVAPPSSPRAGPRGPAATPQKCLEAAPPAPPPPSCTIHSA